MSESYVPPPMTPTRRPMRIVRPQIRTTTITTRAQTTSIYTSIPSEYSDYSIYSSSFPNVPNSLLFNPTFTPIFNDYNPILELTRDLQNQNLQSTITSLTNDVYPDFIPVPTSLPTLPPTSTSSPTITPTTTSHFIAIQYNGPLTSNTPLPSLLPTPKLPIICCYAMVTLPPPPSPPTSFQSSPPSQTSRPVLISSIKSSLPRLPHSVQQDSPYLKSHEFLMKSALHGVILHYNPTHPTTQPTSLDVPKTSETTLKIPRIRISSPLPLSPLLTRWNINEVEDGISQGDMATHEIENGEVVEGIVGVEGIDVWEKDMDRKEEGEEFDPFKGIMGLL
jgi:hypothetical protein